MTTFATQLDRILTRRGHTSYWLAKQMRERGRKMTAPNLIDHYRRGQMVPSWDTAVLIANILDVPLTFFTEPSN